MAEKRNIVCFGAGPAFKGGMSNYNTSLAKTFASNSEVKVHIVSWLQQYPNIVPREFKDSVSKVNFLEGTDISCQYLLDYNKPSTWTQTADYIASLKPEKVIIQWSIAIQGLPLASLIKKIKKRCETEVIMDLHFVIQKEQSVIDKFLSKYAIKLADSYIVHALKTYEELQILLPQQDYHLTYDGERKPGKKAVLKLFHPIYDLYQPDPKFDIDAFKKQYNLRKDVILFFGFIRKYKGLDRVIEAFAEYSKDKQEVSLLICGESFWNTLDPSNIFTKIKKVIFGLAKRILLKKDDDERDYRPLELIEKLGIKDKVAVFNSFIPNEDVHKYFQVSDCVVLYYTYATPSGIESLSYNFNLPILATKVGHFPETIEEGKNGYLAEETHESMVATIKRFFEHRIDPSNVDAFKVNLSWEKYIQVILNTKSH
jgi:glycosyltransferase involved in cell wall biosynthesis